jgi:hypothetical protein
VLRDYLRDRPADLPVWPGTWWHKDAEMIRPDLEAAAIPHVVDGPEGPLYVDLHSIRHTFVALLDRSGATLKEAMQLARHSDPKLTMAVYGRAQLHDLGKAVGRLPSLLNGPATEKPALAGTGTDGASSTVEVSSFPPACASGDAGRGFLRVVDETSADGTDAPDKQQPLAVQGVESDCEPVIVADESAPRRTRTYNLLIKRRAGHNTPRMGKPVGYQELSTTWRDRQDRT